jgi:hypothetical protein
MHSLTQMSSLAFIAQYGCISIELPWTTKAVKQEATNLCPTIAVLRDRIQCWICQHLNSFARSLSLIIHYWSFIFLSGVLSFISRKNEGELVQCCWWTSEAQTTVSKSSATNWKCSWPENRLKLSMQSAKTSSCKFQTLT